MRNVKRVILIIAVVLFCISRQELRSEIGYPWKDVYIGALEGEAWAGMVIAPTSESVFAFRIQVKKENTVADGLDFLYLVSEVGPHSPDGRYARIKFDLGLPFGKRKDTPILKKPGSQSDALILEWSRQDERTVIGRILPPKGVEIRLIHYFPWNFKGKFQFLTDKHVKG